VRITPGYRQDHLGRTYQIGNNELGQHQVHVEVREPSFSMRFHGDSKGHRWRFPQRGTVLVERCDDDRCGVCGPTHDPRHTPVGAS
jgi:hypothetical protein